MNDQEVGELLRSAVSTVEVDRLDVDAMVRVGRRRHQVRTFSTIGMVLAIVAVVGGVLFAVRPGSTTTVQTAGAGTAVPVPDVVGLSQSQATTAIERAGLLVDVVETDANFLRSDSGEVLATSPAGQSLVPAGTRVLITVAPAAHSQSALSSHVRGVRIVEATCEAGRNASDTLTPVVGTVTSYLVCPPIDSAGQWPIAAAVELSLGDRLFPVLQEVLSRADELTRARCPYIPKPTVVAQTTDGAWAVHIPLSGCGSRVKDVVETLTTSPVH